MNIRKKVFVVLIAAIISVTSLVNEGLAANGYKAEEWATIINLAGRQRMLTQKMSKEMLLVAAGMEADANRASLKKTAALFGNTLKGLRKGNKELDLRPAKSSITKKTLQQVGKIWIRFKKVVDKVVSGGKVPVQKVAELNLPLLKRMNVGVKLLEREAKNELGGAGNTVINYAGRQRMLTQKMSKEMLLIYLNHNKKETEASLKKTTGWFGTTLQCLRDGGDVPYGKGKMTTVPVTADPAIKAQLDVVKGLWDEFKPLANDISQENISKMATLNLPLLKEMNKAVQMYASAQHGKK